MSGLGGEDGGALTMRAMMRKDEDGCRWRRQYEVGIVDERGKKEGEARKNCHLL